MGNLTTTHTMTLCALFFGLLALSGVTLGQFELPPLNRSEPTTKLVRVVTEELISEFSGETMATRVQLLSSLPIEESPEAADIVLAWSATTLKIFSCSCTRMET